MLPESSLEVMYDLVIYGSTSGAVATAIQAARLGRLVALVSPNAHIGKDLSSQGRAS